MKKTLAKTAKCEICRTSVPSKELLPHLELHEAKSYAAEQRQFHETVRIRGIIDTLTKKK